LKNKKSSSTDGGAEFIIRFGKEGRKKKHLSQRKKKVNEYLGG